MNMKFKTMVAAVMLTAAVSSNAALTNTTATTGSSLVFSAWDANGSYAIDLGALLNTYIGADPAGGVNASNTLTDSGFTFSGAVAGDGTLLDIALTGFSLTSGSWNLAAADGAGRKRALISENSSLLAQTNAVVGNVNASVNSYLGAVIANGSLQPTIITDPTNTAYAGGALFGNDLAAAGLLQGGSANALGTASNIYVLWQDSTTAANAQLNGGVHTLVAGGNDVFGVTYLSTVDNLTHFKLYTTSVAAVPETETWAMAMLGLGFMGFIARRRGNQA